LSEDPIGFSSGDSNFYRYVGNRPLIYIDPYGENKWDDARKRVRRCKKIIKENLNKKTCEAAKEINENYECKEWRDNIKEILNPDNWLRSDVFNFSSD